MQDREELSGCMQPVAFVLGLVLFIAGIFCLPIVGIGLLMMGCGVLLMVGGIRGTLYY